MIQIDSHEKLEKARKILGLNGKQMAKALNDTPYGTYRKWERGERHIPPCLTLAVAYLLDRFKEHPVAFREEFDGTKKATKK